jgi:carbonic anhydrase/acetyltransferase-like protein (isoleucine patch superfamily)
MQLYLVDTARSRAKGTEVFGLGSLVTDARVLDRPLSAWHEDAREAGDVVTGPALVIARDCFLSEGFRAAARDALASLTTAVRLRAKKGTALFDADPLAFGTYDDDGHLLLDAWLVPAGATLSMTDDDAPARVASTDLTLRERALDVPVDREAIGKDTMTLRFASATFGPVSHWAELQRVNVLALLGRALEGAPAAKLARYLFASLRALAFSGPRLSRTLSRIGTGCDIHPTAVVEGSRIGDFVEIGPFAVVRGCHIGNDARIDAQAICELSVIGEHARVQRRAMVNASTVYPHARMGGILQLGVAGERAATKMFAVGTDMRLDGKVRVDSHAGLRDVDQGYMGVCIGHGAFVGSGVWIAPGRVVPACERVGRRREDMWMGVK